MCTFYYYYYFFSLPKWRVKQEKKNIHNKVPNRTQNTQKTYCKNGKWKQIDETPSETAQHTVFLCFSSSFYSISLYFFQKLSVSIQTVFILPKYFLFLLCAWLYNVSTAMVVFFISNLFLFRIFICRNIVFWCCHTLSCCCFRRKITKKKNKNKQRIQKNIIKFGFKLFYLFLYFSQCVSVYMYIYIQFTTCWGDENAEKKCINDQIAEIRKFEMYYIFLVNTVTFGLLKIELSIYYDRKMHINNVQFSICFSFLTCVFLTQPHVIAHQLDYFQSFSTYNAF